MTIGISMDQEICLILGEVSLSLPYKKRNLQTDFLWSGERLTIRQVTSRPPSFLARTLGENGKKCQAEGEA